MKVYFWGTGRLAGKVIDRHIPLSKITGFIDNDKTKKVYMGKTVYTPEMIAKMEYDAILVCNLYAEKIVKQCKELEIDMKRVVCLYNNCRMVDINKNYRFVEGIIGREYAQIVKKRYKIVRAVEAYGNLFLQDGVCKKKNHSYINTDYVRIKSFELAVKEMRKRNVQGSVAELGVFRGEFAQYINVAFPNKTLYLFDTFDGFDAKEAFIEKKNGNCSESFIKAYENTNIDMVLSRMAYPERVVIKQGLFPESLNGLEDRFAFVSLDADFEESIYQGLVYFYPRLEKSGYIFIHDYSSDLLGVERAVDRYEKDHSITMAKVPLCDANGTMIITK